MRQSLRPAFGLPFLAFLLCVPGVGAAPAAAGEVTSLLLDSSPDDPIGNGEFGFFTPADGQFTSEPFGTNQVRVDFRGRPFWSLQFAAPPGETLEVGIYENTVAPIRRVPGQPGLQVFGNAVACFNPRGRFEVLQVVSGADGLLERFRAVFEQSCGAGVLRGEIRFNADVPVVLRAPSRQQVVEGRSLAFEVEGFDQENAPVSLEATGVPPGAAFTDRGAGTGGFAWTPEVGRAGAYWVGFRGRSTAGAIDTVYTRIEVLYDFDDFDRAIPFSILPFASTVTDVIAGIADDDPECFDSPDATVWYAFTPPADARIHVRATNLGPPGSAGLAIYTGDRGALSRAACGRDDLWLEAKAGTKYSIMVGTHPGTTLLFRVEEVPPAPGNDDLDAATLLGTLPFGETLEVGGATYAGDDPPGCGLPSRSPNVWYAYTPAMDTRITVDTAGSGSFREIAAFTGPRGPLVTVACGFERLGFTAAAGRTYHLRVAEAPFFGHPGPGPGGRTGPISNTLVLSITGRPPLQIRAAVDGRGSFDPRTGVATIRGTAECSQPARIVVRGRVQQSGAIGEFETITVCDGAASWVAEVTPAASRYRHGRFAAGPARVVFEATGVPDDDPTETAGTQGLAPVVLGGAAPSR